jgi:hypothetical protein
MNDTVNDNDNGVMMPSPGFCKTGPFQGFPENCHYYSTIVDSDTSKARGFVAMMVMFLD